MKKYVLISVIALFFVAAAAVMFFDLGVGFDIALAGVNCCGNPNAPDRPPADNPPTDLTPLFIFLGAVAVCGVLILIMVIRHINANKEYKKRQKKKQMKREEREKSQ